MNNYRKTLLLLMCAVLLVGASAFGTLAYLTDSESVTNTFSVGSVGIQLDEADVKLDGTLDTNDRVDANDYHLLPGHTYIKDPTVTVDAKSEESYIRMLVTFNYSSQLDAIFSPQADLTSMFNGYNAANWALHDVEENTAANTRIYEFRYIGSENAGTKPGTVKKTETDIKLDSLFDSITVPGSITKEQLATLVTKDAQGNITSKFTITAVAHAIQAAGFDTADLAWAAFDAQTSANP